MRASAGADADAVLAQADADSEAGLRLAKTFGVATWPTMLLWRRGPAPEATLTPDERLEREVAVFGAISSMGSEISSFHEWKSISEDFRILGSGFQNS